MKREMEAYIVLLHLVSQGWAKFADIRDLLGWEIFKQAQGHIVAHINEKLFAFRGMGRRRTAHCFYVRFWRMFSYICENIFDCDKEQQPSPRQIAQYAKAIATYDKWDKVLEVFRDEAFQG